jgi:hypothetical protein
MRKNHALLEAVKPSFEQDEKDFSGLLVIEPACLITTGLRQ